jgi:hypothetical protein
VAGLSGEQVGDSTLSRSDLDDNVLCRRVYMTNDSVDNARICEEVLPKALPGSVASH